MKFKKIISAVSAFAMAASLFTVASAASLGGKPTITASFDGYEKMSDTVAFAYVNVTIDMTAAETLEAYSNELDETTWEEVIKGNGIKTMGSSWTIPAGFTYTKAKSTIPAGLTVDATKIAFGPKTNADEYWVTPVTTVRLAYRVSNFDAKGDVAFATGGSTIAGLNSAESNALWDYADAKGTITLTGCSIPSYNEWSKPAGPTVDPVNATEVTLATPGEGEELDTTSEAAVAYKVEKTFAAGQTAYWTATIGGAAKKLDRELANLEGTSSVGLIITGNATISNVALNVVTQN